MGEVLPLHMPRTLVKTQVGPPLGRPALRMIRRRACRHSRALQAHKLAGDGLPGRVGLLARLHEAPVAPAVPVVALHGLGLVCLVKHAFRKCADETFGFVLETFSGFVTPAPGPAAAAAGRVLLERYRAVDVGRGRADRQEHLDVAGVARRQGGRDTRRRPWAGTASRAPRPACPPRTS